MLLSQLELLAQNIPDASKTFKLNYFHAHGGYSIFRPDNHDRLDQVEDLYMNIADYVKMWESKNTSHFTIRNYLGHMLTAWNGISQLRDLFSEDDQTKIVSFIKTSKNTYISLGNAKAKVAKVAKGRVPASIIVDVVSDHEEDKTDDNPPASDTDNDNNDNDSASVVSSVSKPSSIQDTIIAIEVSLRAMQNQNEILTKRNEQLVIEREQATSSLQAASLQITALQTSFNERLSVISKSIKQAINAYITDENIRDLTNSLFDNITKP